MSEQQQRPWADLPDLALFAILRFLRAIPDLYAFAGSCRSWRAILRSTSAADFPSLRPPLLLRPFLPLHLRCADFPPFPRRPDFLPLPRRPNPLHTGLSGFYLQSLDDHNNNNASTNYSSVLPHDAFPANTMLGCAFGFVIFRSHDSHSLLLIDAVTGQEIHLPGLPPSGDPYYYATLTMPPSSPDCHALLFYAEDDMLSCRMGDTGLWVKHRLPPGFHRIARVLVFKNRLYAVNRSAMVFVADFNPQFSFKPLDTGGPLPTPLYNYWHFGPQLIECGGEMLLVMLVGAGNLHSKIHVYKLDFMKMKWMRMDSLGDLALFIDHRGRCPVSCPHPEGWGGRSNCIYLADPGCDTWAEIPLDDTQSNGYSPDLVWNFSVKVWRWPRPLWIYPSLFF